MHITIFLGGLSGGGAERVACNIANYLFEKGHNVCILTVGNDNPSYTLNTHIERFFLASENTSRNFLIEAVLRIYRFLKFVKKNKTDVYVVFLPFPTVMLLSVRWLVRAKVIASERADPNTYSNMYQHLLKRLACKADAWVFQTNQQKEWYGDSVSSTRSTIIANAINEEFILPEFCGERRKLIVTAGRLNKQKNHRLLLKAFAQLSQKYVDYVLHIYGEGPLKEDLQMLINEYKLVDRAYLSGYSNDVISAIKDASLFVLSSDYEGMPNALMESMALGLPCISTDCGGGGARFLIDNGVNGILVPCNDADALASAMDEILSDKNFANRLGKEARKISERFSPDKIYGYWEQFIGNVVKD